MLVVGYLVNNANLIVRAGWRERISINEIEIHIREHEPTESAKFIAANAYQKIGKNIDDAKSGLTTKQRELKIIENAKEHMILASLISHK